MKLVALAAAGFVAASAPASAQYIPRPMAPIGPLPPESVSEIVRHMGLEPVGAPVRSGPVYFQRAADYYGKPLRVVIDAHRAQVVMVEPVGAPPMLHRGPYASAGAPILAQVLSLWNAGRRCDRTARLGDGAAWAAATSRLAASHATEAVSEVGSSHAKAAAGAAQARLRRRRSRRRAQLSRSKRRPRHHRHQLLRSRRARHRQAAPQAPANAMPPVAPLE